MENQLMQVKTQVAVAIADQHALAKKKVDHETSAADWKRKAELAVAKAQDDLARGSLERALSHQRMATDLAQQLADQTAETDSLRAAYSRLQQKLSETHVRVDVLIAQLRRNRVIEKAGTAQALLQTGTSPANLSRLAGKVEEAETRGYTARGKLAVATADSLDDRIATIEQHDQIEALLLELKERHPRLE
jgi:phage shock protein A